MLLYPYVNGDACDDVCREEKENGCISGKMINMHGDFFKVGGKDTKRIFFQMGIADVNGRILEDTMDIGMERNGIAWMDGIDGFDMIKAIDGNFLEGGALSSALWQNSGNSGIVE